jgi:transcriptional regulator with XRE-family HTH domain
MHAPSYKRLQKSADLSKALVPIREVREVAKIMGLSKSTVCNIERQALEKIRVRMLEAVRENL